MSDLPMTGEVITNLSEHAVPEKVVELMDLAEGFLNSPDTHAAITDIRERLKTLDTEDIYLLMYVTALNHGNHPKFLDFIEACHMDQVRRCFIEKSEA